MAFDTACDNTQMIDVTASPNTGGTNPRPALIEGALVVTVISGDGTFSQDPATPLVVTLISGDSASVTEYDFAGDANLDPNVAAFIHETVRLTVTSAAAAGFGFVAGIPTAKP